MTSQPLAGLFDVVRLIVRRDRLRILLWSVGIVGLVAATAASITGIYDTPAQLDLYAQLMRGNTALIVQAGPGYGLDSPTTGAVVMNEVNIWTIVAIALMNVFIVVRHTRTDEETERAELLRAAPVGRYTAISAALLGATLSTLVVTAGVIATLLLYGLPVVGSLAFGAALVGAGSTFAAVSAVASQGAGNSRTALAAGGVVLAVSFVLRAVGDVGNGRATWLSPIGWAQAIRAFADERWWVLLLPAVATAGLSVLAFVLQERRDFGAGLVEQHPGRARATPHLRSPLTVALRLQRTSIAGWTVGLGLMGFFYGIVADQAEQILDDNPEMADFFAQFGRASITDAYLATSVLILALIASGSTISSVLRMRTEELSGRADAVLATPTTRLSWATGHMLVAAGGSAVIVGVSGTMLGAGLTVMTGDLGHIPTMFIASMVMVPALWVIAAVTMLLYGLRPGWALAAWLVLVGVFVLGVLGDVLDLPGWALDLSPFEHPPAMPAEQFTLLPIVLLIAAAGAAFIVGSLALRRRDIS